MGSSFSANLPVIGICGYSGSGKTTLIEALVPRFINQGLRVAVVKHGAKGVSLDKPGKDSDRFYRAGADVVLLGNECFFRFHQLDYEVVLRNLCLDHDLVLVEGHRLTVLQKIWLLGENDINPPPEVDDIVISLYPGQRQVESVFVSISAWLERKVKGVPVYGCLLIGGKSRRMGQPKHLLMENGQTWLEKNAAVLEEKTTQLVLVGRGDIPPSLAHLPRIPDTPGLAGPLSGMVAVMRWQPQASWLVAACDLPDISGEALNWLLKQRKSGVWGVLPTLEKSTRVEPLLAWYDFRMLPVLEKLVAGGCLRPALAAEHERVKTPAPPLQLQPSWRNINTAEERKQREAESMALQVNESLFRDTERVKNKL